MAKMTIKRSRVLLIVLISLIIFAGAIEEINWSVTANVLLSGMGN